MNIIQPFTPAFSTTPRSVGTSYLFVFLFIRRRASWEYSGNIRSDCLAINALTAAKLAGHLTTCLPTYLPAPHRTAPHRAAKALTHSLYEVHTYTHGRIYGTHIHARHEFSLKRSESESARAATDHDTYTAFPPNTRPTNNRKKRDRVKNRKQLLAMFRAQQNAFDDAVGEI